MPSPGEDDREAIDRAFAELVAGYHLTAERPEPAEPRPDMSVSAESPSPFPAEPASRSSDPATPGWADDHPLFRYEPAATEVGQPGVEPSGPDAPAPEDHYVPPPPPPLPKPGWPALLGWLGMGYAIVVVLAVVVGVDLPVWAGWAAIIGFVGGFGILVVRLPRHRPPDAGDGAVV